PKPQEEVPEEKQWPTGKRRPLPEEPKEEIVLKPIPRPLKESEPKEVQEPTIKPKPIPELDDKPEPELRLEKPIVPEEDTSLPPWRRGKKPAPKREIAAAEPAVMETVTLKPTPKRSKELPQESIEEVSLKPVPQMSEIEDLPSDTLSIAELKDMTAKKVKIPKRKEEMEPLEKPVYPKIPEQEDVELEKTQHIPEEVVKQPELISEQPPWRRTPKSKPMETEEEEKKWPTGKRRPPVEEPKEEVVLKPIPKPTKDVEPEAEKQIAIKPKQSKAETKEDMLEVTPWRRGKKEKPVAEEDEPKEWPKGKRRPLPESPKEEVVLKPFSKPSEEEPIKPTEEPTAVLPEPEQPKPAPWRRGKTEFPKDETPKEEVTLKPVPKRSEPEQTVQEEVILKPIPAQQALVEEIPAPHGLQPVRDVKIEEIVTKKTKRIKKQIIKPKFSESDIAEVEESVTFEKPEEPAQVAETIVDIVAEEVLDLIPDLAPLETAKKRKSRNKKHVVFKEELSTFAMQPEEEEQEEDELEEEQVQEISRSSITLTRPVPESKPTTTPVEEVKVEEQTTEFRKEMEVRVQSNIVRKEKQRRVFIDDSQPLPELEIITQKRIQEVTDKIADENIRETRQLLETTQQQISETKIQERTVKVSKPKVQPPNIVEKLQPQICEPDKPVQLRCRIEGVPFPTVQWYFNDTVLFANSEYIMNVVEDVATLEIATVQPYHVGIYTCEAKNVAGVAISKANIVVQEKPEHGEAPRFIVPLKIELNEQKTVATVTCKVAGIPIPKVRWLRDEVEIIEEEEEDIETYYEERTGHVRLTVKHPKQNVPVVFTVVAENKFGKAVGRANVYIQAVLLERAKPSAVAPQIVEPLEAQVVRTGSTLVFECRYTGQPKPTVKWFRNSKEIVEEEEEVIITTEEYYSRLEIRRVTRQRGGKYEITVTNEAGQAKSSASVAISDATDMDEAKAPRFIEPLMPKLIAEAEVCILEVSVESYPTSTFQWFKEGTAIQSTSEQRIVTKENRSILIIESFTRRDTGAYTCRAENVAGSVTSTATVQTLDTTETEEVTEYISPRFLETIKPTRVMDGERLTLECQVVAMPLPKVHWYHNSQQIQETKDKQVQQDSTGRCVLTISEVFPEDKGEYTCVATNKIGEAICRAAVNVEPFEYVPDSEQFRSSEEDLLTDKSISTLEEYAEPIEYAPQIVKQLPSIIHSQERELTKLEVKVLAHPKPQIRWLKAGEEIIPSEEFQIENFEDGTSILIINDIYPDDSGEITFEAHNALGVAMTTTELVVEEIVGTKAYRKPEWVQHMEELKEALQASYSTPSYSLEIKDSRAMLGEKGFFECHFAGNPKPDILWYRNGKIIIANDRTKIRTSENTSTLTIYPVEVADFGFYKCKAMNEAGTTESISKLIESTVPTLTDDEKAELDASRSPKRGSRAGIKNGKAIDKIELVVEESEEVRREKAEKRKKREEKRKQKESQLIEDIVKQEMEQSLQEKIKFSSESTTTLTTSTTSEMTQDVKLTKDRATVKFKEHVETLVEEIVTTETVQEIERMVIHEKLDVSDVESVKNSIEVKEILTNLKASEFGPGEAPLRELATIAFMVKHGVTVSEITSFYQANHFPALQKPESQSAMVLLLEREGYANIVTEILTETDMDETVLAATAGFRAFMRMIEVNHASVEEIIAHFSPDDFVVQEWKTETAFEKHEETRLISSSEVRTTARKFVASICTMTQTFLTAEETPDLREDAHSTGSHTAISTITTNNTTVMKKKHKKLRSDKRQQHKHEEETEIVDSEESIEERRRLTQQRRRQPLQPLRPLLSSEDQVQEELAPDFLTSPVREAHSLPLEVASVTSESTVLSQVSNLVEPDTAASTSATVKVVPETAVVTEEIFLSEREFDTMLLDSARLATSPHYNLFGVNEPVQVSEVSPQESSLDQGPQTVPQQALATADFVPVQPLVVSEPTPQDSTTVLEKLVENLSSATLQLLTHDATIVQETVSSQSERELSIFQRPTPIHAHSNVLSKESLQVTEVNRIEKEDIFDGHMKLPTVQPYYQILPSESIQMEETITQDAPSRYYPELVVPTESARPAIVEQKSYTTEVMNAPEKEDTYQPGRLPPQQWADVQLLTKEPLSVTAQQVGESEVEFTALSKISSYQATGSVTMFENQLTTQLINDNITAQGFQAQPFEAKRANVEFLERTSVSVSKVISNEAETTLAPFEVTDSAMAQTTLTALKPVSESTLQFVHEKETLHQGAPRPNEAIAVTLLEPIENLAVTEVETADTAGRFSPEAIDRSEQAFTSFVSVQSHSVTTVDANEKEADLPTKTAIPCAFAEPQLNLQYQLEVVQHETGEREFAFQPQAIPHDQVLKPTATDSLKSVQVQETIANVSATELHEATPTSQLARVVPTGEHEEKIVSETTIYETLRSQEDMIRPEEKTAELQLPNLASELIVTEVVSGQTVNEECKLQELAKDQTIKPLPTHSLKTVVVEETVASEGTDRLNIPPTQGTTQANVKGDELEETIVSEAMVFEDTQQYTVPDAPALKSAIANLERPVEGLTVMEVISEQREQEEIIQPVKDHSAKPVPSETLKSVLIEEVQLSSHAETLQEAESHTSEALVKIGDALEQTTIQELLVLEDVCKLKEDSKPEQKQAETLLQSRSELTITEVVAEDREREGFDVAEIAKDHTARSVPTHTLKSVQVETTEAVDSVASIVSPNIVESLATLQHDQLEEKIVSEQLVLEGLNQYEQETFGMRQAVPAFEPNSELMVTEVVVEQKEQEKVDELAVKDAHAQSVPTHTLKSVTVEQVEASESLDRMEQTVSIETLASVRSDQLEQTMVCETIAYEATAGMAKEVKPTEKLADLTIIPINEILVSETVPEQREKEGYNVAELAQDYVAKQVPTHSFKSVQVEETIANEDASQLAQAIASVTKATTQSDELEQTTVSETFALEQTPALEAAPKPTPKSAESLYEPQIGVIVTEINADQKERDGFSVAELAQDHTATPVAGHALKTVTVEEITLSDTIDQLKSPEQMLSSASVRSEQFEQTTVQEMTVYEGSHQLPVDEMPAAKSADLSFVPNAELIVTEIVSEQKEREGYNVAELARDHTATTTVTSHSLKSITIQETLPEESVDKLQDEPTEATSATFTDEKLQETVVREALVLETIDNYTMEFTPSEKQALPNVTPMTELLVTEVIVEQKEKDGFSVQDIAQEHVVKMLPAHTLKSVIVEEVHTSDVVGDVDQLHTLPHTASVRKEQLESQTVTEQLILEGLEKLGEQQKPTLKSATSNIEAISELLVTEVVTEQKEQEGYDVQQIASNYNAKEVPSHTLRSALIEETQPIDDVKQFVETPHTSHAKPLTNEIEERVIAETVVLENVDTLEQVFQPESKHAEKVLQSQTELHITEVNVEQKEQEGYSVDDLIVQQSAKTVPTEPLKSITVEEIIVSSITGNITDDETASTMLASVRNEEHQETTISEQVVYEATDCFEQPNIPEGKAAASSMQLREELVVTEVVCEQKESEGFDVQKIASSYSAQLVPSQILKSLAVEQVEPVEMHGTMKEESIVPGDNRALVNELEHEQKTIQETMIYEMLSEKPTDQTPEQKLANIDIQPVQELVVTEVIVEQKEREGFDVHEISKDYTAHLTTAGLHKSIAIQEIHSSDALEELRAAVPTAVATAQTNNLQETVESEATVLEAITNLLPDERPVGKTASTAVLPNVELQVLEVVVEQREKEGFDVKSIAQDFLAEALAEPMKSIVVEEIQVSQDVSELVSKTSQKQEATTTKDQHEQTIISETLVYEDLGQHQEQLTREEHRATTSLDAVTGITITEVITEQKAKEGVEVKDIDSQKAKLVPSNALKSLTVELVETLQSAVDVPHEVVPKSKALVKNDTIDETTVTETMVLENTSEYKQQLEQTQQTANTLANEKPKKSLIVQEVLTLQESKSIPTDSTKPIEASFNAQHMVQTTVEQTTVYEGTEPLTSTQIIDKKYPTFDMHGLELPLQTAVDVSDTVNELKPYQEPMACVKACITEQLPAASITETVSQDSYANLSTSKETTTQQAQPTVSNLFVSTTTETVLGEGLDRSDYSLPSETQTASIKITDMTVVPLQSELLTSDTAQLLEETMQPRKFATASLEEGLRAPQCVEVASNEQSDVAIDFVASGRRASVTFITNQTVNVSETTLSEYTDRIELAQEPEQRFARLTESALLTYEESHPVITKGKYW
uniref:Ig-like domain-containing protein n=1 Tax=Anopheles christyi TaxID=43041 RepID=A0A182K1R7_9DIPT